ncbi:MAG: ribonuclease Z [Bacteroidales bacterium]
MAFEITFLGTGAALPTLSRGLSAAVVNIDETLCLIDCGEATQLQMLRFGVKRERIRHIFISHLHGDHYFGLVGLLFTWHLHQRKEPIHIWGPALLKEIIELQIKSSVPNLSYEWIFHDTESLPNGFILEEDKFYVIKFPLKHRLTAYGYLIRERGRQGNIDPSFIEKYKPAPEIIKAIKAGADFISPEGKTIPHTEIVTPPHLHSFAWCSDTSYNPVMLDFIQEVDVLYHEATFMKELQALADEKGHSTTIDAALIAAQARVGQLVLGHISQRYSDMEAFVNEAKSIFPNSLVAYDGLKIRLRN